MLKLAIFLAVAFAAAALAWMLLLPVVVTSQLRASTGFDAAVTSLVVNPFTGDIEARGFRLTNPPTFPVKEFIEVRRFSASIDLWSLFGEQTVVDAMAIDVGTVTLVKSREGRSNAEVLRQHLGGASPSAVQPPAPSAGKSAKKPLLVRKLDLKLDRLVVVDHSGGKSRTQDFVLGIDQHYTDVSELKQLFAPSVLDHLAPVAEVAADLLPGDWGRPLGDAAKSGSELLKEVGRKVEVKVKGYFDALEESKKP